MRVRTVVGVLIGLLASVGVAYVSHQNVDLLTERFSLSGGASVPVYGVLIGVFLLGFLPPVTALILRTIERDLGERRSRRLQRDTESAQIAFRRGVDYQADGQWAAAAKQFETVLEAPHDEFSTLLRYGQVLRSLGRIDEAIEVHRRASVLYPQSVALLFELADDYERDQNLEVAREIRNRILRDFSDISLSVARHRRNVALEACEWREAAEWQEKIESLVRELGAVEDLDKEAATRRGLRYQYGLHLLETDQVTEAKQALEEVLTEEPRFIPAGILLGEASLIEGDEHAAIAQWKDGYDRTGSPVFLQRIEDHFIEREQPVLAIENLRQLIASADNDLFPRFFLGRLYYRLEMHQEALKLIEPLRERIESSPTLYVLLARVRERLGEDERAAEHYRQAIQEAGIDRAEFFCRSCTAKYPDWRDRCERCGSWSSIEIDLREERLSPEKMGVRSAPVWAVYGDFEAS